MTRPVQFLSPKRKFPPHSARFKLLSTGLLILAVTALIWGPAPAKAETFTINDFYVPSTSLWVNTGLWIDPGDLLIITAYGTVIFADPHSANQVGPDGLSTLYAGELNIVTDSSIFSHSLVGNIALTADWVDGAGFYVGSNYSSYAPIPGAREESGWLYLAFNDQVILTGRTGINSWGLTGDNHGSFVTDITLIKGAATPNTPEPGTMALLGSGMVTMITWRRRRAQKRKAQATAS